MASKPKLTENLAEVMRPGDEYAVVQIDRVHPNTWNPNVVPEETMQALEANVERAGFNMPVLVRPHPVDADGNLVGERGAGVSETDFQIIDGEHRWRTEKSRGSETITVVIRPMTDGDAKAQTIAMNKLRGEMDAADVARIVREAEEQGLALGEMATFTGYSLGELEAGQKLLEFDWSALGDAPDDHSTPPDPADRWIDLAFRVPESIAQLVNDELDRCLVVLGHEGKRDTHLHMALELVALNSYHTPEGEMGGDR